MIMKKLSLNGKMLPLIGVIVKGSVYYVEELGLYLIERRARERF